jgi:cellulose synthase operon protein C
MTKVRFEPSPGTHRHRVQGAIARARRGAIDEPSDVAGRRLAGAATFGDRDGARALQLIGDDSRRVRGVALVVAPLACDDDQATAALRVAWSIRGERPLLRRMARRGRTAAIDAFLDGLAADGQLRDLIDDLPFGSEAAVRRHLAHALERPSRRFWDGVALGHPGVFGELVLARWGAAAGEADPVTRQLTDRHHGRLAERVPEAAAALAELLLARGIEPAKPVWTELLRRRPRDTVELAIRFAARLPAGVLAHRARQLAPELLARIAGEAPELLGDFGPRVRTMSPDRQRALADAWLAASQRFPVHGGHLLRYLPDTAERDAAYQRWSLAARDTDGVIATPLIAALPIELAAREAARHVREVTVLAIDPARRLRGIARYLPWAELEPALRDQLGHPDGDLRAVALAELLANPGVYPDEPALAARALELVVARKFEQDPVRFAMLETLALWPRRVWRAEHLPAVARAIRDALDAADLSVATAAAAQRLITRLFGVDARWAATQLATAIKERGALYDPNLGAKLSDADLVAAAPQLCAIAKTWATQERAPWLIGFASGLGARLTLVTGLDQLLAHARDATPHEYIAQQLTEILARHAPALHAATLAAALARFRKRNWYSATFAVAESHGLVGRAEPRTRSRRRPTLPPPLRDALCDIARELDTRYAPTALALLRRRDPAAFDAVVAQVVARDDSVAVVADVHRWIHRHRQDLLTGYLGDRVVRGRWATAKTRWILPWRDGFFRWAPAQVERFATSLEAITGDAARDIPAVFSALTTWPAMEYAAMDRLCALAADARPAVREKAIRVLARCDAGQGVPTLLACLGDDRARFAIYGLRRALFGMIPERALALLADAPMRKVTVAKEVVRLTGELRAAGAFARLTELAATELHRDVRMALLRALWDHLDREHTWAIYERAVSDPDWVVASRLADIPADRLTARLDARLADLLARVLARPEPDARIGLLRRTAQLALVDRERALLAAIRARLASPYDDEVRAAMAGALARSTETDMPALGSALDALRADPRALHVAADALYAHDIRSRASWRRAAVELEAVASRDPRWSALAVRACAVRAVANDLVATLERVALDLDASLAARTAIAMLDDDDLDGAASALAASARPGVRRVAVFALEHAARPGRGWTAPRLALLARLRADPSSDVAGAAARLWPPREQDPGAPGWLAR